jgi:dephospho-CoA kinase
MTRAGARTSPPPRVIGLTGGIGAGKSEALAAFARCGAAVLSSDQVVHDLYADPAVAAAVAARFGADVVAADGRVDRAALGPRAFAQPGGIAFLEGLLHPLVGRRRVEWTAEQRRRVPAAPLLVCEVPLLFEAGSAASFDAVLVVTAGEAVRRERVAARGQTFDERRARQLSEEDKVARADRAYVNDGSLQDLQAWVAERFREYAGRPCGADG